jgi:hypothetical protein
LFKIFEENITDLVIIEDPHPAIVRRPVKPNDGDVWSVALEGVVGHVGAEVGIVVKTSGLGLNHRKGNLTSSFVLLIIK